MCAPQRGREYSAGRPSRLRFGLSRITLSRRATGAPRRHIDAPHRKRLVAEEVRTGGISDIQGVRDRGANSVTASHGGIGEDRPNESPCVARICVGNYCGGPLHRVGFADAQRAAASTAKCMPPTERMRRP